MPNPPADYRPPRPPTLIGSPPGTRDLFSYDPYTDPPHAPLPSELPRVRDTHPTGQRSRVAADVAIDLAENDIYGRWLEFHRANLHVYRILRRITMEAAANRFEFGIGAVTEIARWERRFSTEGEDFKIPNAFRSMYARLLMEQEADLTDFFHTAELRTAIWPDDERSQRERTESVR